MEYHEAVSELDAATEAWECAVTQVADALSSLQEVEEEALPPGLRSALRQAFEGGFQAAVEKAVDLEPCQGAPSDLRVIVDRLQEAGEEEA